MLRSLRQIFAVVVPAMLLVLLLAVLLCYVNRWDELVVITLIPMWAWATAGALISVIAWPTLKSRFSLITFVLWSIAGVSLSDEATGLLREFRAAVTGGKPAAITEGEESKNRLRVVTLNCDEGTLEATGELKKLNADIVLLQEAPERAELIDLTAELFESQGTFIRSEECAILAEGRLSDSFIESETGSLVATLERPDGEIIDLINVRLPRAIPRFDIWNAECWRVLTERRKLNRRTLRKLLDTLPERRRPTRQIVGGSFGAPPSDDIFRLLRNAELTDSYRQSGYGWGNTYPVTLPLLRVDQTWASSHYVPTRSETFASEFSDHRYVVSDFLIIVPEPDLAIAP